MKSAKEKGRLGRLEELLKRLERAEALVAEGRVHEVEGLPRRYVVEGSRPYLVDLFEESCTCPDFAKGHTCKHLMAAYLWERERTAKTEERKTKEEMVEVRL